ncbi:MAG: hypothetical protein ACKV0T_29390 [Planctomycetales bacterium]
MLSITGFHGLTMTPNWLRLTDWLASSLSLGNLVAFSLGMTLLMLLPIAVYAALVWLSFRIGAAATGPERLSYHDYFVRYAYALLPIALFYHLAHNMEHLLMEGPKVLAMISDPFGWNWNLFGTASWKIPPLISLEGVSTFAELGEIQVGWERLDQFPSAASFAVSEASVAASAGRSLNRRSTANVRNSLSR